MIELIVAPMLFLMDNNWFDGELLFFWFFNFGIFPIEYLTLLAVSASKHHCKPDVDVEARHVDRNYIIYSVLLFTFLGDTQKPKRT